MHEVRILRPALDDMGRLDKTVARRIMSRLEWLALNFEAVRPEPLTGDLTDLYKLRVGDYRVVYEVLPSESVIVVHAVGHRREIYKR